MSNTCREDGGCLFTRLNRPSRLVAFGHARQTRGDAVLVLLQKFPRAVRLKSMLARWQYLCGVPVYVAVVLLVLLEFR